MNKQPIKSTTATDYRMRLNRVIDHLHKHLDDPINIDDLADVAHLSPYHWHRIYTAIQGETVATTLKRLRLERAADKLANTEMSILTIAQSAQYSSTEAFGRAFKQMYSMTPAKYRTNGSHNEFKQANLLSDHTRFEVLIEPIDVSTCASVPHLGSYMKINHAMSTLLGALAEQNLLTENSAMMAVFFDDPDTTPVNQLRSSACSPLTAESRLVAPLERLELFNGNYAKLRYIGPYADMKDAYRWLYGAWLPNSGHEAANAPCVEMYLNNPQEVSASELQTLLCLPLATETA